MANGVLDFMSDPANQGLLSLASGLLQAGGPSRVPVGFGQALGMAGEQGLGAYNQARAMNARQALADAQAQEIGLRGQMLQAQMEKMGRDAEINRQILGGGELGKLSPDQLGMLGQKLALSGHPGAATVMTIADKRRDAEENTRALRSMQSAPAIPGNAPVNPAIADPTQGAEPGIPAKPGATAFLQSSPYVGDAVKALQAQINSGGITPQQAQQHLDRLLQMHTTQAGLDKRQETAQNNRIDLRVMTGEQKAADKAAAKVEAPTLDGDALDQAAARYRMDGTLPTNLGRGAQGSANTIKILNKAAEQAKSAGDTPEETRIRQISGKAATIAMQDLTKREQQVGAFEKNFTKNTDLVLELSDKVDRMKVPLLNKWVNAGKRAVAGDADLVALDTAIKGAVNEYAKIVSGSMGNTATAEGEIRKIEELMSAAQTPAQIKNVITTMKRETANRMKGFAEQKAELKGSLGGSPKTEPAPSSGGWSIKRIP